MLEVEMISSYGAKHTQKKPRDVSLKVSKMVHLLCLVALLPGVYLMTHTNLRCN